MNIRIVVPVKPGSMRGNEVSALRWKSILQGLNHQVQINTSDDTELESDLLIAVHAIRAHEAICQFKKTYPNRPLIVCLSGTDLHGVFDDPDSLHCLDHAPDVGNSIRNSEQGGLSERAKAIGSLTRADAILLLEPIGQRKLPSEFHSKCHVIFQSAESVPRKSPEDPAVCQVTVIGHLRREKDPMLAARASRLLPAESRIQLVHVGEILEARYQREVQTETDENPRYRYLGKVDHGRALDALVSSHMTVLTSIQEGAPSVISEAVVNEVPVLATRIDASLGMLGPNYPGLFNVGDESSLAQLMIQVETNDRFHQELVQYLRNIKNRFSRSTEIEAWRDLISLIEQAKNLPG